MLAGVNVRLWRYRVAWVNTERCRRPSSSTLRSPPSRLLALLGPFGLSALTPAPPRACWQLPPPWTLASNGNRYLQRLLGRPQLYRLIDQTNYRKSVDQVLTLLQVLNCEVDLVVREKTA